MVGILISALTIALFAFVVIGRSNQFGIGFSTDIHIKTAVAFAFRFACELGLHAVQFENNWMKKSSEDSQNWPQNFFHPVISKIGQACGMLVQLLINYIASQLLLGIAQSRYYP